MFHICNMCGTSRPSAGYYTIGDYKYCAECLVKLNAIAFCKLNKQCAPDTGYITEQTTVAGLVSKIHAELEYRENASGSWDDALSKLQEHDLVILGMLLDMLE